MDLLTFRDQLLSLATYANERAKTAVVDGRDIEAAHCYAVADLADGLFMELVDLGLVEKEVATHGD